MKIFGIASLLVPVTTLGTWILVIVAIFQIRSSTQEIAKKLDEIYRFMKDSGSK